MKEHKNSLESKLTKEDFDNIKRIINIAYEREFLKHKSKLINKFEITQKKTQLIRSTIYNENSHSPITTNPTTPTCSSHRKQGT